MAGCVESRTSLGLTPFSGTSLGQVPHCTRTPIEGPDARRRWQGSRNKPARSKFVLSSARLVTVSSLRCNLQTWPPQRAAYYVPHYGRGPANVFAGCSDTATSDTFTLPSSSQMSAWRRRTGRIPVPFVVGPSPVKLVYWTTAAHQVSSTSRTGRNWAGPTC